MKDISKLSREEKMAAVRKIIGVTGKMHAAMLASIIDDMGGQKVFDLMAEMNVFKGHKEAMEDFETGILVMEEDYKKFENDFDFLKPKSERKDKKEKKTDAISELFRKMAGKQAKEPKEEQTSVNFPKEYDMKGRKEALMWFLKKFDAEIISMNFDLCKEDGAKKVYSKIKSMDGYVEFTENEEEKMYNAYLAFEHNVQELSVEKLNADNLN